MKKLFFANTQELCGYVEYKGIIYRISSFDNLEKVLDLKEG